MNRARTANKLLAIATTSVFCIVHGPSWDLTGVTPAFAQPPPAAEPAEPATEELDEPAPPAEEPPPAQPGPLSETDIADAIAAIKAGTPLAQIAQSKGTDVPTLVNAIVAAAQGEVTAKVQAGEMTQAQADEIVAKVQQSLNERMKREAPPPPPDAASPPPEAPAAPPPKDVPAPRAERRLTAPVIVTGVIAGLALANGIVFAIDATGKHSDYKAQPDHQVGLSGERSAFIADVSFGMAALFGITAAALYFIVDDPAPPAKGAQAPRAPRAKWVAGPTALPKGGGFSATLRF